jgi:ribonucleoside-diphosphate reductase alpha chain
VPVAPPYIKKKFWFYQESKHVDQRVVVDVVSRFQRWTDTGISMELLFNLNNGVTAKEIFETHMDAWKKGVKAIYYTRSIQVNTDTASEKPECSTCAN